MDRVNVQAVMLVEQQTPSYKWTMLGQTTVSNEPRFSFEETTTEGRYTLNCEVLAPDDTELAAATIDFEVVEPPLVISLHGGDRLVSTTTANKVQVDAVGTLQWSCIVVASQQDCSGLASGPTWSIPAHTYEAGTQLQITVTMKHVSAS
jgi:hypothetical protein